MARFLQNQPCSWATTGRTWTPSCSPWSFPCPMWQGLRPNPGPSSGGEPASSERFGWTERARTAAGKPGKQSLNDCKTAKALSFFLKGQPTKDPTCWITALACSIPVPKVNSPLCLWRSNTRIPTSHGWATHGSSPMPCITLANATSTSPFDSGKSSSWMTPRLYETTSGIGRPKHASNFAKHGMLKQRSERHSVTTSDWVIAARPEVKTTVYSPGFKPFKGIMPFVDVMPSTCRP